MSSAMAAAAASASAASSAATTQRFDRHVSNATCRLVEINEHLLCALCSGYLVDATTISECLHTFCRSCIVRYLESSETCPVCDVPLHQTNPLLGIRADTTLQTLVYKLVPGVFKDEVKRRCTVINNAQTDGKTSSMMERLLKDICDMTTGGTIYTSDEQFSVCLQYAPSLATQSSSSPSSSSSDPRYGKPPSSKSTCPVSQQDPSDCSYLLCPAFVTIAHLKKLIRNKLELSSDLPLDLYHSSPDGSLDDVFTLADVAYITAWTSVKPLHFYYQVNAKPSQTSVKKLSRVSEDADCKRKVAQAGSRIERLPSGGGTCLKRIFANNRQKLKIKGVVCSSNHRKKTPNAATKEVKSPPGKCLALRIPTDSASRETSSFSAGTSPISGKRMESDRKSDLRDINRREADCDSQDENATVISSDEQTDVESKGITSPQTAKPTERKLMEVTESEITGVETAQKTSPRIVENETTPPKQQPSPNQKKSSGLMDCSPSADSALSPSRPETTVVSQSAKPVDDLDTTSDSEGNYAIDSASSPPPTKRTKMADPNDRNLFAAINSMIVSNNDNVVSSSTSSQASADDSGDNKASVETQTTAKLIGRCSKKGKPRPKKDSVLKSRPSKQGDPAARGPAPAASSAGSVVALSADASSRSISVTAHTYSTAVDTTTQQCTSATLCVPICIGDKTGVGGGGNLILNLPQNVSVECRIRSDKILIASNPTPGAQDVASTNFASSISYSRTESPASQPSPPNMTSQSLTSHGLTPRSLTSHSPTSYSLTSPSLTSVASPTLTSEVSPTMTSEASSTLSSCLSPGMTSQALPTLTSQTALAVKSPAQPIFAASGHPKGSSITRTTATSVAGSSVHSCVAVSSVKSSQRQKDNSIASPLSRQPDARNITENNGNVCKSGAGECQAMGKEVPVKRGAVKRTMNVSDTSLRFRNKDCLGEAPLRLLNCGKSEAMGASASHGNSSPVRCVIPTRSPGATPGNAPALTKPPCESGISAVTSKSTCLKGVLAQKEPTATKVSCRGTLTDLGVNICDKAPQNVATTALPTNPVAIPNPPKTISRPKEAVQVTPTSGSAVTSAHHVTASTSSGVVSTTKTVLFKPYQITTTASSPKRPADGLAAPGTFQGGTHHNVCYTSPTFPMFPSFQYPKDQPPLTHQGDASKAYCCLTRDPVLASNASCDASKPGVSAVHRTMSNIPLHSVIKVPTYTARKMPQNRKSEKKGSKSPRNEPCPTPVSSVGILKKLEPWIGGKESLGPNDTTVGEPGGKLINRPEVRDSKGVQGDDREGAVLATTKGIKNDSSTRKVDDGLNRPRASSTSTRSCLKLQLVTPDDILDRGDSSSCSISTSSPLPAYESEIVPRTPLGGKRHADPPENDPRHSPKRRLEKPSPADEMSYTCAEADSGTSPGAVSLSPPRCCTNAPGRGPSPSPQQTSSVSGGASLRKKLVIDLERCGPRQSKPPSDTNNMSLLRSCSPTTTTTPHLPEAPLPGQATPPRLVISLPRCQIPAAPTPLSPGSGGGCLSQWSPTSSSGATDGSPPTTKRLKLMCNGMTIYRTLESPGSRSPRRPSSGGGSSRRSSPVSAPVVTDCTAPLLSRASSCKSPSTSSPQGKCRRKSNSSAPLLCTGVEPKSAGVTGGESVVVVSVDSTSTSPGTPAAATVSVPSDTGLFTVVAPWKGREPTGAVSSVSDPVEEPLELTTKEVKERQKEREYAKLMTSNQRPPPSAFTT